jgi:glycosyltransferase involved in cell wall biosynthesis
MFRTGLAGADLTSIFAWLAHSGQSPLVREDTVVLAPAGHLLDPDVGSDHERPWRLADGFAKRGFRVVIVAREVRRVEELGPNVELERPPGRSPTSPVGKIIDRASLYLHARRVAYREVASGRVLVVHHVGPCSERSPSLIGRLPVPFVYGPMPASRPTDPNDDEWLSWLLTPNATVVQARLSKLVAAPAGHAAHWLWNRTIRTADAVSVEAHANAPSGVRNVVVIPPGVDIIQFHPRPGGQPADGRIIAVGKLLDRKRYDVLIRAVSRVQRSYPQAHLLLVGSGPQEQSLRLLATQLGIGASVTFTGSIPRADLPRLLHSAEVFCHPAILDTFPLAVLEAMSSGLPTVVSSAGALPEIVGRAGVVHTVGDEEDLARQLLHVFSSGRLREALGTAARARVVERFTWQVMCDAYIDLYQGLG